MKKYIFIIMTYLFIFYFLNGSILSSNKSIIFTGKNQETINYHLGKFNFYFNDRTHSITITHHSNPNKTVWRTIENKPFISGSKGVENVQENHGSFFIKDKKLTKYNKQLIEQFDINHDTLLVQGHLLNKKDDKAHFTLKFFPVSDNQLSFRLEIDSRLCNRSSIIIYSDPKENIFGFGEQFTHVNLKGKRVPIFVSEQGIGRGKQPITFLVDLVANSGGNAFTTYAPVPHYISSNLHSIFIKNTEYSIFDFKDKDELTIEVFSNIIEGGIITGKDPASIIQEYTLYSGRMRPLPNWIHNGSIIGLQGGTERVFGIVNRLIDNNVEIAAVWLQDWVGQRITSFGKQLWWNWELDSDHYHHWDSLMTFLDSKNIRVLTYTNPFLTNVEEKDNYKVNYYDYAKSKSYFVNDENGIPYDLDITTFSASLLDLTNPEVRMWYKDMIKKNMLSLGIDGWMADFGEALPYDSKLHNGETGDRFHNQYPEIWSKLNQEIVEESNLDNLIYFCRSGFSKSPGYTSMFWLGDQLTSWDNYDGIKTALNGLLSSGFSGYTINHSDVGGYTAIKTSLLKYIRSQELLMRWTELNTFTAVLRTHEGNRPDDNHQVYSNRETMAHFSKMSRIFKALGFYRKILMDEAFNSGLPVVRHPFIHYPNDKNILKEPIEIFLMGDEFLIAPVMDEGQNKIKVYLPSGVWIHLWSNKKYNSIEGQNIIVDAPIGEPAVFYKENSKIAEKFLENLSEMNIKIDK